MKAIKHTSDAELIRAMNRDWVLDAAGADPAADPDSDTAPSNSQARGP